jgi:voltage-gated potassium channel
MAQTPPTEEGMFSNTEKNLAYLNAMVLVLSIYVLSALAIDSFYDLDPEVSRLLRVIDDAICLFFIFEFFYRLYHARNRLGFLKWGWIDLVASLPSFVFGGFHQERILRLVRLLRILRTFRSAESFIHGFFKKRQQAAFASIALIAVLMTIFSSIAILEVEQSRPDANIKTAEDAIWWSYVTITTVGYGDLYPVTRSGRIIAGILMTVGVGIFGALSGFVASWFTEARHRDHEDEDHHAP